MRRTGFTLMELIVAVVVLQLALLGVAATLHLAARAVARAERVERLVSATEGIVDSLRGVPAVVDGERVEGPDTIRWRMHDDGLVDVIGGGLDADTLLRVVVRLPDHGLP